MINPRSDPFQKDQHKSDLFVGREEILDDILNWATQSSEKPRILSLIGSPGVGKSWLLEEAACRIEKKSHSKLILRVNLADMNTTASQNAWLEEAIKSATTKCQNHITPFDAINHFETSLQNFIYQVCENCQPEDAPLLVTDGFDEAEDRVELQLEFLSRFLDYGCFNILMAHREDKPLEHSLKQREQSLRVPLFESNKGGEQVAERVKEMMVMFPEEKLGLLLSSTPPYDWNHPLLNTWLASLAGENHAAGHDPWLTSDAVRACLKNLVQPAFSDEEINCLIDICHLKDQGSGNLADEWDARTLRMQLEYDLSTTACIQRFFDSGIIRETSNRYFQVADGIRELGRAWQILAKTGGKP